MATNAPDSHTLPAEAELKTETGKADAAAPSPSSAPEEKRAPFFFPARLKWFFLISAVLVPVFWLIALRIIMLSTGEASGDSYYHMKMAELGPSVFMAKEFPWTSISIWNDSFADKELLYHVLLRGTEFIRETLGIRSGPPFHFGALFFLLFTGGAFVFAAMRLGVPPPLILVCSVSGMLLISNFTYRILMLRPHVFSLGLLFLACGLLAKGSLKFRACAIFLLSVFYTWSYSNPHFIVIPTLCFAVFSIRKDSLKVLLLPVLAFAGVLTGLLVHPQFPNSFLIWKLQSWDALLSPMFIQEFLGRPGEMRMPSIRWHLSAIPLYVLFYFNLLMLTRLTERRGFSGISPNLYAIASFTVLFTGGTFLVLRAVEYASPFNVLLFAMLLPECVKEDILLPLRRKQTALLVLIAALGVVCASFASVHCAAAAKSAEIKPIPGIAQWLKNNVPGKAQVINTDWSDFPVLFYYDDSHRWLWGMDPVFALAASPEETRALSACRPGGGSRIIRPDELFRVLGIRYAVLLAPRKQNAYFLKRSGWMTVYEGDDGWIFRLPR